MATYKVLVTIRDDDGHPSTDIRDSLRRWVRRGAQPYLPDGALIQHIEVAEVLE